MPNRHFLVKFWKCQKAVSILPHAAKALLEVFCFQPIVIDERQNSLRSSFVSRGKIKIHDFTLADQVWIGLMIFKYFADQDWVGFNFIGQGWTWTEKFHSLFISGGLELDSALPCHSCEKNIALPLCLCGHRHGLFILDRCCLALSVQHSL